MTYEEFQSSLTAAHHAVLSPYLAALWHAQKGDWSKAHEIVQEINTAEASWIHAYLHRKEPDEANARYWYGQAGKPFPSGQSLDEEWTSLAKALLEK